MENGTNGLHTKDRKASIVNGGTGKTNGSMEATWDGRPKGMSLPGDAPRINDLPDEIPHVKENFVPLGVLLSRLAQKTHNELQAKILELAKMPLPESVPMANGSPKSYGIVPDDTSVENLNKKVNLLNHVQDAHTKWTKALVIATWSRKVEAVSKLIDLRNQMALQRWTYQVTLDQLFNVKRDLCYAQLPAPDIITALQVLSASKAPWLNDFNYIKTPPLTAEEQLKWIEELNTQLHIRLNLTDYHSIPYYFRDYKIADGRVTFKVKGEFEIDLTIGDEDPKKQFWFIDFRFGFTPAPAEITGALRDALERRVNDALGKDGLKGCYECLHEFTLTHKITEYIRQAHEMARSHWVDTLKIERLNRAMAIQYWTNRFPAKGGPKSWIIIGVNSGFKPGRHDPKATSHLTMRWFRENKEVKDANIPMDHSHICTETLLNRVLAQHIRHTFTTVHERLRVMGRFVRREAALSLKLSDEEPGESALTMQLVRDDYVTMRIAADSGLFHFAPQKSAAVSQAEAWLNMKPKEPAEEALATLEHLRYQHFGQEMTRRGMPMGFVPSRPSLDETEDIKPILKTRDRFQLLWFKQRAWPPQWRIMLSMTAGEDKWWLIELAKYTPDKNDPIAALGPPKDFCVASHLSLPIGPELPKLDDGFFWSLSLYGSAAISYMVDLRTLHKDRIKNAPRRASNPAIPGNMKLPSIYINIPDIIHSRRPLGSQKPVPWAADYVQVMFKGVRGPARDHDMDDAHGPESARGYCSTIADARVKVADRSKFSLLKGSVERDVAFNPRVGVFSLRLKAKVGTSVVDTLAHRLQAIGRLVDCVEAIKQSAIGVRCESYSLARVVFSYNDTIGGITATSGPSKPGGWKVTLNLEEEVMKMVLDASNPHLRCLEAFNRLLNSDLGFVKVPTYLALTLPVVKALDMIEAEWAVIATRTQCKVEITCTHLDSFLMRYTLPGPTGNASYRQVTMVVKMRESDGRPWWHVSRTQATDKLPADDVDAVLNAVWAREDREWKCYDHSAGCEVTGQVTKLLRLVDVAIRMLVMRG